MLNSLFCIRIIRLSSFSLDLLNLRTFISFVRNSFKYIRIFLNNSCEFYLLIINSLLCWRTILFRTLMFPFFLLLIFEHFDLFFFFYGFLFCWLLFRYILGGLTICIRFFLSFFFLLLIRTCLLLFSRMTLTSGHQLINISEINLFIYFRLFLYFFLKFLFNLFIFKAILFIILLTLWRRFRSFGSSIFGLL